MSLIRNVLFVKYDSKILVTLIYIFKTVLLLIGYEDITTILFVILSGYNLVALLYLDEQSLRLCSLIKSAVWVYYDFTHGAFVASVLGVASVVFITLAILKEGLKVSQGNNYEM